MSRSKPGTQGKSMKALVLWSRENKTGVESISSIPQNARFAGAVSPVMFQGDKKYYPAKIIMISDDDGALESKAHEIEAEIEKMKQAAVSVSGNNQRPKRTTKNTVKLGSATVRAIDVATGGRPSVPRDLEAAHKADQKAKKNARQHHTHAQLSVDREVLSGVKKALIFGPNNYGNNQIDDEDDPLSADSHEENSDVGDEDEDSGCKAIGKWCDCKPCRVLQKYDSPLFHNFLKEVHDMFSTNTAGEDSAIKYLELLPIAPNLKLVELSPSSNIYIAASEKDQLKVDYRNKPSALAKETLFNLYGREVFETLNVTGMGTKKGTYTISVDVKKAVVAFINRNVDSEKRMSLKKFTALINKRAPEWRKTHSPKQKKVTTKVKKTKKSGMDKTTEDYCLSTSPFKVTHSESVGSSERESPSKSPHKPDQTWHSSHKSPLKSPRESLQFRPSPCKSPKRPLLSSQSLKSVTQIRPSPSKTARVQFNQEPPSFDSVMATLQPQFHSGQGSGDSGVVSTFAATPRHFSSQGWGSSHNQAYHDKKNMGEPQSSSGYHHQWEHGMPCGSVSYDPSEYGPGPSYASL